MVSTLPRVRTLDHANPANGCAGTLQEPQKLQLYLAFARSTMPIHAKGCAPIIVATLPRIRALAHSTTPIHAKGCAGTLRELKKLQLYLAFARSTTPIHAKGCSSRLKVATLPCVRALDHANPRKGLRITPESCNFTSRSRARPRPSTQRVARGA